MEKVVEDQYNLARLAGISLSESGEIPDFEREVYLDLIAADMKREADAFKQK